MLLGVSVDASNNTTYTYDASGLRRQKAVTTNGQTVTTDFIWGNNGLAGFKRGNTTVTILYDVEGQPVGFTVNDAVYTYVKNIQGDVLKVLDSSGNTVISYSYDPWGVPTITGNTALAAYNPCSYRGYYYDFETGFYYLQSRYYDPELGRFLNADDVDYLGANSSMVSYNLFAYCGNAPILNSDPKGTSFTVAVGSLVVVVCSVALAVLFFQLLWELCRMTAYYTYQTLIMIVDTWQSLIYELDEILEKAQKRVQRKSIAVHHIIAKAASGAKRARTVWEDYCHLWIHDPRNLVVLNSTFHAGLHTKHYYDNVNALVEKAYSGEGKKGVLKMVANIAATLAMYSATYF